MPNPKISVIVPVYNVEKYIAECLDSLVGQTLRDIEIICVDDCSTDGSVDIIKKYLKKDKRIKLICKEKNSGQSDSRNLALQQAVAPYVMFCDSDDFYAIDMCQKMLDAVAKDKSDIVVCSINVIYEANAELKASDDEYYTVKHDGTVKVTDDIVANVDVSPCNKLFKRDVLITHDVRFPTGLKYEDAYFFNAYVLWAQKISFIKDKLYNYRRRANSTMAQTFDKTGGFVLDHLKIAMRYFEYLQQHGLYQKKYEYFWTKIFIPFFYFVLWYCDNKSVLASAFETARDFINQHYTWGNLDMAIDRTLRMIVNGTLERSKKRFGGLVRTNEYIDHKKVRFCGIPVYKVKYFPDYAKHYILGIQYKIIHF